MTASTCTYCHLNKMSLRGGEMAVDFSSFCIRSYSSSGSCQVLNGNYNIDDNRGGSRNFLKGGLYTIVVTFNAKNNFIQLFFRKNKKQISKKFCPKGGLQPPSPLPWIRLWTSSPYFFSQSVECKSNPPPPPPPPPKKKIGAARSVITILKYAKKFQMCMAYLV